MEDAAAIAGSIKMTEKRTGQPLRFFLFENSSAMIGSHCSMSE